MTRHIVTMGGGGFSMSENNAASPFDRYILELSGVSAPMVCFIPTASADDPNYIHEFLTAYGALGVRTMVLTLWEDAHDSVERLSEADVLVVGGGSTVNLLALWQAHGVHKMIGRMLASDKDLVLSGVSAGGCCWYEGCITDSFGCIRPYRNGMGILHGSFCPHWNSEELRQSIYPEAVANGLLPAGWAAEDYAALHWQDGKLVGAIAEKPDAKVLEVKTSSEPTVSGVLTLPIETELLR